MLYGYASNTSTAPVGINAWQSKATITQFGRAPEAVYTNFAGETMIDSRTMNGGNWNTFTSYDTQGRPILSADPSAVAEIDDSSPDLLNLTASGYADLSADSGLIAVTHYYTGDQTGLVREVDVKHGQNGAELPQAAYTYLTHEVTGFAANGDANDFGVTVLALQQSFTESSPAQLGAGLRPINTVYLYPDWQRAQFLTRETLLPAISSQNGSGGSTTTATFDALGREVGFTDADGFLHTTGYDDATGAATDRTTTLADGTIIDTRTQVDDLGRPTLMIDPMGHATRYSYFDTQKASAVRIDPATGPSQVSIDDMTTGDEFSLTLSAGNVLQSLTRTRTDFAGRAVYSDRYADLTAITLPNLGIPFAPGGGANWGAAGVSYYETAFQYDSVGRRNWTEDAVGDITQTNYDALGRATTVQTGTPAAPLFTVSTMQYDGGGVGDGNLTQVTQHPYWNQPDRNTTNYYDWRDRPVASVNAATATYTRLNNLGQPLRQDVFDVTDGNVLPTTEPGSAANIAAAGSDGGVAEPSDMHGLRARNTVLFDDRGSAYRSIQSGVDPSNGIISGSLTTNAFHDGRGNTIETDAPGGLVTRDTYDGTGRDTLHSIGSKNTVVEQVQTTYNLMGNPVLFSTGDRISDTTAFRTSYVTDYYDDAGRLIETADWGTNAVSAQAPSASTSTVHVTTQKYGTDGYVQDAANALGTDTHYGRDSLGRVLTKIENYLKNGPETTDTNKATGYTYNGLDQIVSASINNVAPLVHTDGTTTYATTPQTTTYTYGGTGADGLTAPSNALLTQVQYPDHIENYAYDTLGDTVLKVDGTGVNHHMAYDSAGRLLSDYVDNLPSSVDGTIRKLQYGYDALGRLTTASSEDASLAVKNQVVRVYNGFGQLSEEYQAHRGAVDPAATPSVQYIYDTSNNASRLDHLIYPDGQTIEYGYQGSGLDNAISRIDSVSAGTSSTPFQESYTYLGLSQIIGKTMDGPNLIQKRSLDAFGMPQQVTWTQGSTTLAGFSYAYNADGTVQSKTDLTWKDANGQPVTSTYGYDGLGRQVSDSRGFFDIRDQNGGALNGGTTGLSVVNAAWQDDSTGTKYGFKYSNYAPGGTPHQTYNASGEAQVLTWAVNGADFLKFDAWGRLAGSTASGGASTGSYTFAYDADGRLITTTGGITGVSESYYDGQRLLQDDSGAGDAVWSPDGQLIKQGSKYALSDASANVTALANQAGAVTARFAYDADGRPEQMNADYTLHTNPGQSPGAIGATVEFLYRQQRYLPLYNDFHNGTEWIGGGGISIDASGVWYDALNGQRLTPTPSEVPGKSPYDPGRVGSKTDSWVDWIPGVGLGRSAYYDWQDGNHWTSALEWVGAALDAGLTVASLGGSSVVKTGLKSGLEAAIKEVGENALKIGTEAGLKSFGRGVATGAAIGGGIGALQGGLVGYELGGADGAFSGALRGGLGGAALGGAIGGAFWFLDPTCFVAGTELLTPAAMPEDPGQLTTITYHSKRIEEFREGDLILSRTETDPEGPLHASRVEKVFVRVGRIFELTVGGRLIRTTAEHPFFARSKGWTRAVDLVPAEELLGHDGRWAVVGSARDTGRSETVYNLRVADDHTYFVGCEEWGFSVWAHNANCSLLEENGQYVVYEHGTSQRRVFATEADALADIAAKGAILVDGPRSVPGRGWNNETYGPNPVKATDVPAEQAAFLASGPYSNIHPRTGLLDLTRTVSADGLRSIRFGPHELASAGTSKYHYHEETWTLDATTNVMNVDNVVRRIQ